MSNKKTTVYTKDGRCGELIKKEADNKYLIQLFMDYAEYSGNCDEYGEFQTFTELSETMIYVDRIFERPPVDLIEPTIVELKKQVADLIKLEQDLKNQIFKQNQDLKNAQKFTTDLNKWHFDLSQFRKAKRVIFFTKDNIAPFIFELPSYNSDFERIDLQIKISLDGKDKSFAYCYNDWGRDHSAQYIDEKYGYMFDLSDEDILKITLERSENLPLEIVNNYQNKGRVPSIYLTERFKTYIAEQDERNRLRLIEDTKNKIESQQKELEKLTAIV